MATILFPFVGGDAIGGSHVSALTVAAHLDQERFRPRVVIHGTPGRVGDYVRSLGLDYDRLPDVPILAPAYIRSVENASPLRYLSRTLWTLRRVVRDTDASIVHTNDGRMHVNWTLPARLGGAHHLWHHREDPTSRGANWVAPWLAHRLLSVSHFAVPRAAARVLRDRVEVVRSPFVFADRQPDRAAERGALLAEIGAPADAVLVGYVGGLIDRKQPERFVDVVARTQAALPGHCVHGVLFGEPDRPDSAIPGRVRAKAKALGIDASVHLLGHRSPIAGPMSALDVLAVTALNEPFGRTLIEAMDLGLPVVATRHGGNVEAIVDGVTGFLVPPDDLDAFARRIARLLLDPESRRLIVAAARQAVHAEFGLRRSVEGVERSYEWLLRDGRGGPTVEMAR